MIPFARAIGQRLRARRVSVLARRASADAVRNLKAHVDLWQILGEYCHRSNSTGCSFTDYWQLYSLVRRMRPADILECGTGVSTVVMAAALRDNERQHGEPGRITSMEDRTCWFEHAKDIFPRELEPYVEILFSPQTEYHEGFFCGVGYESIPRRRYDLAFIDGPDDHGSPAGTPTVDLDYIRLLKTSPHPVLGVIDGRLATCFVYQSLLGLDKVRFEAVLGLTFIGPCSSSDLRDGEPSIGWGRCTKPGFYTL